MTATVAGTSAPAVFLLTNTAGPPASVSVNGGSPQAANVNSAFAVPLSVTVSDANNNPVSNIAVSFTVVPSLAGANFNGLATATSSEKGIATAPTLIANGQGGTFTVAASVAGLPPANFNLTNNSKSASAISVTAGGSQSAAVNTAFATLLQATVTDSGNNPVSGVTVTFAAPSSGPSGVFTGPAPTTAVTGANGVAAAPAFTANNQAGGPYTVTATVAGVATPASFSLTNTPGVPASITANAGSSQSTTVSLAFATPLQALVKDAGNNPLSGITVTFAVPATGPSGVFTGPSPTMAVTGADGIATAPALTANTQAGGPYNVTATVAGVPTPASFSLTNTAGPPATITATAGSTQSTVVNTAFATLLQATVTDVANNPVGGVIVTFAPPSNGASAGFTEVNTALTNSSGIATAPVLTANALAGAYSVSATVPGASGAAGFNLVNTPTGILSGSGNSSSTATGLTSEGSADWVHWGDAALNRKAGVPVQISNDTVVGTGTVPTYANDPRLLSWADGSPTVSAPGNASGIYINGTGNGFSFTAPADLTPRKLTLHAGGWNSGGTLTTHLSDGSAVDYMDVTTSTSGQYDRNYTLIYSAGSAGQTLTLKWVMTSGTGNVTLNGAALALSGPSIAATAGNPQSAPVNTAFATPLQATVLDAVGNPLSGVTVTFAAPPTGASAVFSGPTPVTALTDTNGIATAPALTSNNQVGGPYTVTASIVGATTASFSLTNMAGPAAVITALAGTPQSTMLNTAFAASLQATVTDSANDPVGGVTVTFTAPGSGASAAFGGAGTITAVTNNSGVAIAAAPIANGQTGSYRVTASVSGVSASASFNLVNNPAPPKGSLSGTGNGLGTAASLTSEGIADWVHWGDSSLNRKAGVAAQISNDTLVGSGAVQTYNNDPRPLSWTDGSPTPTTPSNTSGLYVNGTGNGFSITAPADTGTRKLTIHVGGWLSGGTLTAHLSDGSAPDYVDVTAPTSSQYDRNYTLIYSALTTGQTLSVKWVNTAGGGNVTLNGAALSLSGPSVTATGGTPQSTAVNTLFAAPLQVVVKDANGSPLAGTTVTFATPASGASAVFGGPTPVTALTDANGNATAPTLTANNQIGGPYAVTASAVGATPASFSLTNTAGPPAAITATAGNSQSAPVNTAFATLLQATVTDSANNPVSGVTVTFTPPSTGASAVFKGTAPTTAVTGANGIATASVLTANSTAGGPYSITASVAGVATPASFNLANTAGAPASVTAAAGSTQSTAVNTTFATAPQALVKDASGNPLSGVTVTFAAPATGPSAVFSGTAPITAVTGANGIATAPALTANGQTGGPYNITARVTGITAAATFSLTNTAGTPASVTVAAGDSQSAAVNARFATALQAFVKDANNIPLTGVTVTFATPTSGPSGAFVGTAPTMAVTGANGIATAPALTANSQAGGPYTVTARVAGVTTPASFSLTNTAGSPAGVTVTAGSLQSATVNSSFSTNLQAVVKDASNNLLSGVTVTFAAPATGASAALGGPATATTNASGVATAPALTANGQAGNYTVTASVANVAAKANFSLTNLPGPPASITATAGTPQSTTLNLPFGTALQAVVKDASNNLLSGVTVTFTAPTTGPSAAFGGLNSTTAVTNASGMATAPAMTANGQAGAYAVTASVTGVGTQASFSLTNSVPAAVPIKLVQGNTLDSMINLQTASIAFKSNNTAGNWIGVVISGTPSNNDTFTVTDSKGNVYHPALVFGGATLNTTLAVYYAENIKAGANTVKVVPNTGVYLRIAIVEYSGIATANSLDVTAAAQGNSASANSGNATTTAAGDLLLGALITRNGHSLTGSGGYTFEQFVPAPPNTRLGTEDQVQTGSRTVSANANLGTADNWILGMGAFKAAH